MIAWFEAMVLIGLGLVFTWVCAFFCGDRTNYVSIVSCSIACSINCNSLSVGNDCSCLVSCGASLSLMIDSGFPHALSNSAMLALILEALANDFFFGSPLSSTLLTMLASNCIASAVCI